LESIAAAVEPLTRHDPAPLAEYLAEWINPNKERSDRSAGYSLGSSFAWRCGKDREIHLKTLCRAKDPYIRVAGAVYLCFEKREEGMTELREAMKLEGDPGAWAALNLARRGEKAAIDRALEVFSTIREGGMAGVPHRNLQLRLQVLLSNSAKRSGLAQPEPPSGVVPPRDDEEQTRLHSYYLEWWRANAEKAMLHDPWLELLEKQKVD
jgi:hypothetical protein